jgi:hypothetical protein
MHQETLVEQSTTLLFCDGWVRSVLTYVHDSCIHQDDGEVMEKKYIIFSGSLPVIFSAAHIHADIAAGNLGWPTSAGYFHTSIEDGKIKVRCYGDSESLKLKPAEGDELFLEMLLNEKDRRS